MKRKESILLGLSFIVITSLALDTKSSSSSLKNGEVELLTLIEENDFYEESQSVDQFVEFAQALGHRESGNNYEIENEYGYIGRFQFGKLALKEIGLAHISKESFKKNKKLQIKAFQALLSKNKHYLRDYLCKYDGKIINNIKITESGMLAASHLVGASSVKKFLKSNGAVERKDGNGTRLSSYMKKFSNYDLSSIDAKSVVDLSKFE